jgi:hypothetical protein
MAFALQKLTDEKKEAIEKDLKKILGKGKIEGEDVDENGDKNGAPETQPEAKPKKGKPAQTKLTDEAEGEGE